MSKRDEFDCNDDFNYCFQPTLRCECEGARPATDTAETVPEEDTLLEPTVNSLLYTQGYLKSQIGKKVKISFLVGTNLLIDRAGILVEVGVSYVVIKETNTNVKVMCDIYSIKFVEIYE